MCTDTHEYCTVDLNIVYTEQWCIFLFYKVLYPASYRFTAILAVLQYIYTWVYIVLLSISHLASLLPSSAETCNIT